MSELDKIIKEIKAIKIPYDRGLAIFLSKNGYSYYVRGNELVIDITSLTPQKMIKIKRKIKKKQTR